MSHFDVYNILLAPHVTEKAYIVEKYQQYVFKVMNRATKHDVKKAVEKLFNVVVEKVNIVNQKGKKKMFRQKPGQTKNFKHAYVTLKSGQHIDFQKIS